MKFSIFHITIALFCLAAAQSCTKETQISEGNPVPSIVLESITPLNIEQFKDSLKLFIRFEDGDGDIGFENADISSLEIRDTRLSKPDMYYVPPQAPLNAKIHIKGTLKFAIRNLFLLSSGSVETTTLEMRLKDRSGNWSNKITSPVITIHK